MKTILTVLIVLLAAPVGATSVDETYPTGPRPTVTVEALAGSIDVSGWAREEVQIRGTLGSGVEGLEIEADKGSVDIEVKYPDRRKGRLTGAEADLELFVPFGADLEIETVKGTITVVDVSGELELQTVLGGIEVTGATSRVEAETVSGDIRISGATTEVDAHSVGGMIVIEGAGGEIEVATMNGLIQVAAAAAESVSLESMSGEIEFRGDLLRNADLSVDAYSSNVMLVLPSTVSARFDIHTQSGDIENAFGQRAQRGEGFMPGKSLEFSLGDGTAEINVESFSGKVVIAKHDG